MKFGDALSIIERGGRCQRETWRSAANYGLAKVRAGSGSYLAMGYGGPLASHSSPWKTAAIDVLADDWRECPEQAAAPIRAYKDD